MVRITAELLATAYAYINPLGQRELSLRSYQIPMIENLAITKDSYDVIDLSSNSLLSIENIPFLPNLCSLFLHDNEISKIDPNLAQKIPNLKVLLLNNNNFYTIQDLYHLKQFNNLTQLSLINNEVCQCQNYRLYLIHLIPSLKVLDYNKIKDIEREESKTLFGDDSLDKINNDHNTTKKTTLSIEQINEIKELIKNATSLAEMTKLEAMLRKNQL